MTLRAQVLNLCPRILAKIFAKILANILAKILTKIFAKIFAKILAKILAKIFAKMVDQSWISALAKVLETHSAIFLVHWVTVCAEVSVIIWGAQSPCVGVKRTIWHSKQNGSSIKKLFDVKTF